jgi:hypothetical protein
MFSLEKLLKKIQASTDADQDSLRSFVRPLALSPHAYDTAKVFIIHGEWAKDATERIRTQCMREWDHLHPTFPAQFKSISIPQSYNSAEEKILAETRNHIAPKTLIAFITFGEWENTLVSAIQANHANKYLHMACTANNDRTRILQSKRFDIVTTPVKAEDFVAGLLGVLPDAKQVALLTDVTSDPAFDEFIQNRRAEFVTALNNKNVQTHIVPWSVNNIHINATEFLEESDAVIVLEGPSIEVHRSWIISACNKAKTLLCCTELDSVIKGAGLGAGITLEAYTAPIVRRITDRIFAINDEDNRYTFTIREQEGMRYNMNALDTQGISLTDEQRASLLMRSVFSRDCIEY